MDFNATPMPEPKETTNIFEREKTPTPDENSYGTFLEPQVISTKLKPDIWMADLSQNRLYRKRMERRKLEKNYLYSVQFMDNYVEYTTESPGHIQNWLCQKYQFYSI